MATSRHDRSVAVDLGDDSDEERTHLVPPAEANATTTASSTLEIGAASAALPQARPGRAATHRVLVLATLALSGLLVAYGGRWLSKKILTVDEINEILKPTRSSAEKFSIECVGDLVAVARPLKRKSGKPGFRTEDEAKSDESSIKTCPPLSKEKPSETFVLCTPDEDPERRCCECPPDRPYHVAEPGFVGACVDTLENCPHSPTPQEDTPTASTEKPTPPLVEPIDAFSCEEAYLATRSDPEAPVDLVERPDATPLHYRVSVAPCASRPYDLMIHVTIAVVKSPSQTSNAEACAAQPGAVSGARPVARYSLDGGRSWRRSSGEAVEVGCSDAMETSGYTSYHFYVMKLNNLPPGTLVQYQVGFLPEKGAKARVVKTLRVRSPPKASEPTSLLLVGDTLLRSNQPVFKSIGKDAEAFGLFLHLGDTSYTTNHGACYGAKFDVDPRSECGFDCSGLACQGVDGAKRAQEDWKAFIALQDESFGGRTVLMTTMGNHDNDLTWFHKYRPLVAPSFLGREHEAERDRASMLALKTNAERHAAAAEHMKSPYYFSFDYGMVHVVSLGTEDNPFNAYEQWDGKELSPSHLARFEAHYGLQSPMYIWLTRDLASVDRKRTPWVVLITHRPMYHTSGHHPTCRRGGDWYVCKFRETYEPLLRAHRVELYVSGHSHHYQRSKPMSFGEVDEKQGTTHVVIGTGGFELNGENWRESPEWMAKRQGSTYGYVRLSVANATHARWSFAGIDETRESVSDDVWLTREE